MEAQPVKVVVRRLPSGMTEEVFMNCVAKCGDTGAKLFYFVPCVPKSRGHAVFSRAYLQLPSIAAAEAFHSAFNRLWPSFEIASRVAPLVEPSPYQRMARGLERPDPDVGTVEESELYKQFLAQENPARVEVSLEAKPVIDKGPIISPLLKDLIAKKQKKVEEDRKKLAAQGPKPPPKQPGEQKPKAKRGNRRGRQRPKKVG